MKPLLRLALLVVGSLGLVACAGREEPKRPIRVFYQQAMKRWRSQDVRSPVDLGHLQIRDGALPGIPKRRETPESFVNESFIIVTDPDPSEREAVQVIVTPMIEGAFLDPEHPTEKFLRERAAWTEDALKNHRYTGVYLLPRL